MVTSSLVAPEAGVDVQSPAPSAAGALAASQGSAWQMIGASTPATHDEEPLIL